VDVTRRGFGGPHAVVWSYEGRICGVPVRAEGIASPSWGSIIRADVLDLRCGVFDLLAHVLDRGLDLVGLALVREVLVTGDLAKLLFDLALDFMRLVRRLVLGANELSVDSS
jgi:hypothetical protein